MKMERCNNCGSPTNTAKLYPDGLCSECHDTSEDVAICDTKTDMTRTRSTYTIAASILAGAVLLVGYQVVPPYEPDASTLLKVRTECVRKTTRLLQGGHLKPIQTNAYEAHCFKRDSEELIRAHFPFKKPK